MPSPSKPREALDSEPYTWARHGEHKPLFETCQEPTTAAALSFATCKEKELAPIIQKAQEARQLGQPSEWSMLLRRLKIFSFSVPFQIGPCKIPECPACFADLVISNA